MVAGKNEGEEVEALMVEKVVVAVVMVMVTLGVLLYSSSLQ